MIRRGERYISGRTARRDFLGFISVHDILGGLITHMFPPGPMGFQAGASTPPLRTST